MMIFDGIHELLAAAKKVAAIFGMDGALDGATSHNAPTPTARRHRPQRPKSQPAHHHTYSATALPMHTDFSCLRKQRVKALIDWENICYSAENLHGIAVSPSALAAALRREARSVDMLAVFTGDPRRHPHHRRALEAAGIATVVLPRDVIRLADGKQKTRANADASLALECGRMLGRLGEIDCIAILTGDGALATALGRGIRRHRGERLHVVTAGVPNSISGELRRRSELFDRPPIALGRDALLGAAPPSACTAKRRSPQRPSPHQSQRHGIIPFTRYAA